MCRTNLIVGFSLIAFGIGVLIGIWVKGGLLSYCFGLGLVGVGYCFLRKK